MRRILFIFLFFSLLLAACGSVAPTEEPAVSDYIADSTPNYDLLRAKYAYPKIYCKNTWVASVDPAYAGFGYETVFISETSDTGIVTQVWQISLSKIQINDREVDVKNWNVVQRISPPDDRSYLVQELNPEEWITRAKEIAQNIPSLTLRQTYTWSYNKENNEYEWQTSGECTSE